MVQGDKRVRGIMDDIMYPRKSYSCAYGLKAMGEDVLVSEPHGSRNRYIRAAASCVRMPSRISSHSNSRPLHASQDFLCAAAREQGPLKTGQHYWAAFALGRVQSALCVRTLRALLAHADSGADVPIESSALLLVIIISFPASCVSALMCMQILAGDGQACTHEDSSSHVSVVASWQAQIHCPGEDLSPISSFLDALGGEGLLCILSLQASNF